MTQPSLEQVANQGQKGAHHTLGVADAQVAMPPAPLPGELPESPGSTHPRPISRFLKRAIDIVLGTCVIVLLSPLWLVTAILIRLDSHGPVFFKQPRIGRNGEPFEMLKFRTMIRDADHHKHHLRHLNEADGGLFKISADPRVTRFGAFLRSTSLDELPQFLHVLTGRISIVGPRPLVPDEDALILGDHRRRLQARPGLTGPWQVAGASLVPLSEMIELDCAYVENWTVGRDLLMILGTAQHVIRRRGI